MFYFFCRKGPDSKTKCFLSVGNTTVARIQYIMGSYTNAFDSIYIFDCSETSSNWKISKKKMVFGDNHF